MILLLLLLVPHRPLDPPPLHLHGMTSQWGKIEQQGTHLFFHGNTSWHGWGFVQDDGRILVFWLWADGQRQIGLYSLDEDHLVGVHGWESEVFFSDGSLDGCVQQVRLKLERQ